MAKCRQNTRRYSGWLAQNTFLHCLEKSDWWPWEDGTGLLRGERTLLWRSACDHLPLGGQLTDERTVYESGQHPEAYFSLVFPRCGHSVSIVPAIPFSPQQMKDAFSPFYYICLSASLLLTKAPLAFRQSVSHVTQFFTKHSFAYSLSGFSVHQ